MAKKTIFNNFDFRLRKKRWERRKRILGK